MKLSKRTEDPMWLSSAAIVKRIFFFLGDRETTTCWAKASWPSFGGPVFFFSPRWKHLEFTKKWAWEFLKFVTGLAQSVLTLFLSSMKRMMCMFNSSIFCYHTQDILYHYCVVDFMSILSTNIYKIEFSKLDVLTSQSPPSKVFRNSIYVRGRDAVSKINPRNLWNTFEMH